MSYDKDGFKVSAGANLSLVQDRPRGDKRFERYANNPNSTTTSTCGPIGGAGGAQAPVSSTFDAFQRMAAGLEGRTVSDKINDPNRPTWEQYKKQNEDKLDLVGADEKKMIQYRVELDKERELKLAMGSRGGKKTTAIDSESEGEGESDDGPETAKEKKKRRRKEKKEKKREKKEKKEKKRRREEGEKKKTSKDKRARKDDREDGSASSSGSSRSSSPGP